MVGKLAAHRLFLLRALSEIALVLDLLDVVTELCEELIICQLDLSIADRDDAFLDALEDQALLLVEVDLLVQEIFLDRACN